MKTIQEIKDEMTNEWMSNPNIKAAYQLDSTKSFEEQFSKVSLESIIFYIVAYVVWLREAALESWRKDIDATAISTRYGTKEWWHKIALVWQDGDMTSVVDGAVEYSVVDETKRKITYCAVREEGRTLYLRVACGSAGNLFSLTAEELARFQSYLNDVKPLGVRVIAYSYNADNVTIAADIYYDGEVSATNIDVEVRRVIDEYLSSIVFGGDIYASKMVDVIQSVKGVVDVHNLKLNAGGGWQTRKLTPNAGYVKVAGYGLIYNVE